MTLEMANFEKVGHGVCTANKLVADNGQHIINIYRPDEEHNEGDVVVTIPLKYIKYCRTNEDMTLYGFVNVEDDLWENPNYEKE